MHPRYTRVIGTDRFAVTGRRRWYVLLEHWRSLLYYSMFW